MSWICVADLTFGYEDSYEDLFQHVSFQMDTDWKLGLVGRNGRGKTTFLKLLCGEYAYSGSITANVEMTYFPYPVKDPSRTVLEILEEDMPEVEIWKFYREIRLLDVGEEVVYLPFESLSSGEKTKVLLAALFIRENRFLLLDEPTNHLDQGAREKVGEYLEKKKGFILVSHDRKLLDQVTDHTLAINRTEIQVQKGNFSSWYANKEARDQMELARNERLKEDIRRLKQAARQASDWSDRVEKTKYGQKIGGLKPDRGAIGHKAAKMMKRAKTLEQRKQKAVEEKSSLLRDVETAEDLKLYPQNYRKETLLTVRDLSLEYGDRMVFEHVSFQVRRQDRICLRGKNGCGKSSILKRALGMPVPCTGVIETGSGLLISYVPQDTNQLKGRLEDYAKELGVEEALFKSMLRKLDFEREQFGKEMHKFSEGQKKKVLLAGSLCQKAHLYIWDEPLNYVDVLSRIQIEHLILEFRPTLLFVEHDTVFQENIATGFVEL